MKGYMDTVVSGTVPWNIRKVILLGKEGVGKTTLSRCLGKKNGKIDCTKNLSTDGIEMSEISLAIKKTKSNYIFNIWDFGGQVIYYPTHQFFLSSKCIYILVFNYKDIQYQQLDYWMKQIKNQCTSTTSVIMVGTHSDQCAPEHIEEIKLSLEKRFSKQSYPAFLKQIILPVDCSSGDGILDVKITLNQLAATSSAAPSPSVPVQWFYLFFYIKNLIDLTTDRVGWDTFIDWCNLCDIQPYTDPSSSPNASLGEYAVYFDIIQLFENSGILLYLGNDGCTSVQSQIGLRRGSICPPMQPPTIHVSPLSPRGIPNSPRSKPQPQQVSPRKTQERDKRGAGSKIIDAATGEHKPLHLSGLASISSSQELPIPAESNPYANSQLILSPQWFADMMACFITTKANFVNNGIIKKVDIPKVFTDTEKYPPIIQQAIVSLLERFKIIYHLDNDKYLIPSMLPPNRPGHDLYHSFPLESSQKHDSHITFGRIFSFPSLPLGLFERVVVALLSNCSLTTNLIWKSGIVLESKDLKAFIEYNEISYEIYIYFRILGASTSASEYSPAAIVLIRSIISTILNMISSFHSGISESTKEYIMCPHCLRKGTSYENIYRFTNEKVLSDLQKQNRIIYCNNIVSATRGIWINQLAPDLELVGVTTIKPSDVEIKEVIGEGAFGVVYRGILNGSITVAVKQLKLKAGATAADVYNRKLTEFLNEAAMMSVFDHPSIVKMYGVMEEPRSMILQYIPGGTLFDLLHPEENGGEKLTQHQLRWDVRLRYAHDMATGLYYLQNITPPVTHRDLRSPNIFMSEDKSKAIIGDFGLALFVNREVGGVLGSWQWLAPEAIDSEASGYNEKVDIFSLGIIYWELASLEVPYDEFKSNPNYYNPQLELYKLQDIKRDIIKNNLRPTIPPDCPEFFSDLITRCLSADPELRPLPYEIIKILESNANIPPCTDIETNTFQLPIASKAPDKRSLLKRGKAIPLNKVQQPISFVQNDIVSSVATACHVWVGTKEGKIILFDWDSNSSEHTVVNTWEAHKGSVRILLKISDTVVWSCGTDGDIRVWNIKDGNKQIKKAEWKPIAPTKAIYPSCMGLVTNDDNQETVWVGSGAEGRITCWSVDSYECGRTITGEYLLECSCITQFRSFVWISSKGGNVSLFDASTRHHIGTFNAHQSRISSMIAANDTIWTASNDITVWKMQTLSDLQNLGTKSVHGSKVTSLFAIHDNLFSISFDGAILMWSIVAQTVVKEVADTKERPVGDLCLFKDYLWCFFENSVKLYPLAALCDYKQ